MKIAFPVEKDKGMESELFGHFGSAPLYIVAEAAGGSLETVANDHHGHAHGQCQPTVGLTERSIQAVVCRGMGLRAVQKLNAAGISVYLAGESGTVRAALDDFKADRLPLLRAEDACGHHHGCS